MFGSSMHDLSCFHHNVVGTDTDHYFFLNITFLLKVPISTQSIFFNLSLSFPQKRKENLFQAHPQGQLLVVSLVPSSSSASLSPSSFLSATTRTIESESSLPLSTWPHCLFKLLSIINHPLWHKGSLKLIACHARTSPSRKSRPEASRTEQLCSISCLYLHSQKLWKGTFNCEICIKGGAVTDLLASSQSDGMPKLEIVERK